MISIHPVISTYTLDVSLLDNIYTLASHISDHNAISGIIIPDVLKKCDVVRCVKLMHIDGISMLIRID